MLDGLACEAGRPHLKTRWGNLQKRARTPGRSGEDGAVLYKEGLRTVEDDGRL